MKVFPEPFRPSRAAGLARLERFVPHAAGEYARLRNLDLPGHPHVSGLSPYLRYRLITEPEVIDAVVRHHGPDLPQKFLTEVYWRAYWKGWLQMRPAVWRDARVGLRAGQNRMATEQGLRRTWEAACRGNTGIEGFDHWAHELVTTGYLHNHARMWFASVWIFTLHLPWELGADFFLRHLIDGDPASNTLSWRWVAGLHTPGKSYLATADNIERHTEGRFRPIGLATEARRIDGTPNPDPGACPQGGVWTRSLPTALLLHEDDLHPDWLLQDGLAPVSTAFALAPEARSALMVDPRIATLLGAAMEDCATRLAPRLGAVHGPVRGSGAVDALVAWARASHAAQIVTPFAPVGPMADLLDDLDLRLAAENIRLIRAMRPYDARLWPLATHGFFRFRESMQRASAA